MTAPGQIGAALLATILATGAPVQTKPHPTDPAMWKFAAAKDARPALAVNFDNETRFGLTVLNELNPVDGKKKRLTYWESGTSNNTVVKIEGSEYFFGRQRSGVWVKDEKEKLRKRLQVAEGRQGFLSEMEFGDTQVRVMQHVEIISGVSGLLDTALIYYRVENRGTMPKQVGLRFMLDTFIGTRDGVPFLVPGDKEPISTMAHFAKAEVPVFVEAVEDVDNLKDPGVVAQIQLKDIKLPGVALEPVEAFRITRWPGNKDQGWDVPLASMQPAPGFEPDSCGVVYWAYRAMKPGEVRTFAVTYGLGQPKR